MNESRLQIITNSCKKLIQGLAEIKKELFLQSKKNESEKYKNR